MFRTWILFLLTIDLANECSFLRASSEFGCRSKNPRRSKKARNPRSISWTWSSATPTIPTEDGDGRRRHTEQRVPQLGSRSIEGLRTERSDATY